MNNNPRMAAAAINTALFHIGSKPRRAPEKMNGRKVAIKGSAAIAGASVDRMATDTEDISACGSRTTSGSVGLPITEVLMLPGDPFAGGMVVLVEARAS